MECSDPDMKLQGKLSHPTILRSYPSGNLVSFRICLQVGGGGQEQKRCCPKINVPHQIPGALEFNFLGHLETSFWDPVGQESRSFPFSKALHHLGFGFPTSSIPKLPRGGRRRGPDPNPKGSSSSVPIATGWCREKEEQGGNLGVSMTPNPRGWGCGASPQILQPPCGLGCGRAGFGKHP